MHRYISKLTIDESKLPDNEGYTIEDYLYTIDKAHKKLGLIKIAKGTYGGGHDPEDGANMHVLYKQLGLSEWLEPVVKEWLFCETYGTEEQSRWEIDSIYSETGYLTFYKNLMKKHGKDPYALYR